MASANDYSEGSPVDRLVFFSLILAAGFILSKRTIDWGLLFGQNKVIVAYFLYCLSSIAWSDDSFVLFKRWVKDLGNPIMALVILTEPPCYEAIGVVLRRLSFMLLPLSVLFIRYFPDMGRSYHTDGSPLYTGVGHQKNDLGGMCLLAGIYFAWEILQNNKRGLELKEKDNIVYYLLIVMMIWLLRMSNSQTSLFILIVTVVIFLTAKLGFIANKPSRIVTFFVLGGFLFYVLEVSFHVKDLIFEMLGRDSSLTNRADLWKVVLSYEVNPIIGAGFMSFWTGERMDLIAQAMTTMVNQAHSGYIEQYLNLGYIGVGFIGLMLLTGLYKVRKLLDFNPSIGMLKLSFIITAIFINYTEACFYGINNFWVLLLLGVIDISGQETAKPVEAVLVTEYENRPKRPSFHRYKKN